MVTIESLDRDTILQAVEAWAPDERVALARDILSTLVAKEEPAAASSPAARRKYTLADARGFLKTDRPPPTDEEVQELLEEALMEKYG